MNLAPHVLLIFKMLKMISDIPLSIEVENKLDGIGLTSLSESSKISNVIDSFWKTTEICSKQKIVIFLCGVKKVNKTFTYYLFSFSYATIFIFTRVWPSDHPQIIKNFKTSLSPTEERQGDNKFERPLHKICKIRSSSIVCATSECVILRPINNWQNQV